MSEFTPPNIAPIAEEAPDDIIPLAKAAQARELQKWGPAVHAALEGEAEPEEPDPRRAQNAVAFPDGSRVQLGRDDAQQARGGLRRGANVTRAIRCAFDRGGWGGWFR